MTHGRFFFTDAVEYDEAAVEKHLRAEGMAEHLRRGRRGLDRDWPTFDPASIEAALRALADARGVKAATLIHGIRVAVTGKTVSPGLFEVVALVGRERTRARLLAAIQLVTASPAGVARPLSDALKVLSPRRFDASSAVCTAQPVWTASGGRCAVPNVLYC